MNASEVKIANQEMREVSELVLKLSKKYGASDAELSLNRGSGLSVEIHKSQVDKFGSGFLEAVEARARYRGYEIGRRYAESFEVIRAVNEI